MERIVYYFFHVKLILWSHSHGMAWIKYDSAFTFDRVSNIPTQILARQHGIVVDCPHSIMVKSKQVKLLRKQVAAAMKVSYEVEDHIVVKQQQHELNIISDKRLIESNLLNDCLTLFQDNMGEMYRTSSWGLDLDAKTAEWTHGTSRWIVLYDDNHHSLTGFCNYRFLVEDDTAVLYVYELQVRRLRQGYGRTLMTAMESIAHTVALDKVLLTVFRRNALAWDFYRALDYQLDETSPDDEEYVILSKRIL